MHGDNGNSLRYLTKLRVREEGFMFAICGSWPFLWFINRFTYIRSLLYIFRRHPNRERLILSPALLSSSPHLVILCLAPISQSRSWSLSPSPLRRSSSSSACVSPEGDFCPHVVGHNTLG